MLVLEAFITIIYYDKNIKCVILKTEILELVLLLLAFAITILRRVSLISVFVYTTILEFLNLYPALNLGYETTK